MIVESVQVELPWPLARVADYRIFQLGRWKLARTPAHRMHGYWGPMVENAPGYALLRKTSGKWRVWMSLTAMELQSHQPHIAAAHGSVVVGGLGMGMYLYNILAKPEVKAVLVYEIDQQVIALFNRIVDWRSWPGAEKLEIRYGDVMRLGHKPGPKTQIDFLYMDIWKWLGMALAPIETAAVASRLRPDAVGYWGQEFDYVSYLMKNGIPIMEAGEASYRAFVESLGIPLIGLDFPNYPRLAAAAVALQSSIKAESPTEANAIIVKSLQLAGALPLHLGAKEA